MTSMLPPSFAPARAGLGLLAITACTAEPTGAAHQAAACSTKTCGDPCEQVWRCGGNSPVIDAHGFHDLSLFGEANAAGLAPHGGLRPEIRTAGGAVYELAVSGSEIRAMQGAAIAARGAGLRGATISIDDVDLGQPDAYVLRIDAVRTMTFPFPEGTTDTLEVYELSWGDPRTGGFVNLCANPPTHLLGESEDVQLAELLGLAPTEAVVFAGDQIDDADKTMSAEPVEGLVNIGCAGHTVAKLHLTRNTIASTPGVAASKFAEQRQATLKLLTADYCGTGRSFTLPGQPLQWMGAPGEAHDAYFPGIQLAGLEARWTAAGATCLDVPRMAQSTLPDAAKYYPDIYLQIEEVCGALPPPCANPDPADLDNQLRISANPVP